jgi:hypothetical protein
VVRLKNVSRLLSSSRPANLLSGLRTQQALAPDASSFTVVWADGEGRPRTTSGPSRRASGLRPDFAILDRASANASMSRSTDLRSFNERALAFTGCVVALNRISTPSNAGGSHASRDTRLRARLTLRLRPLRISDRDRGLPRGRMSCGRIAYGLGMLDAAAPLVYGSPQAAMCGNWEVKRVGGRLTPRLTP